MPGKEDAVRVSKREAAEEQIDQAIRSLLTDLFVCAVTLAGAAEDSLPDTERPEEVLVDLMRSHGPGRTGLSQKQLMQRFNGLRNWLKHHRANLPEVDVQQEDAVFMILRAYTKFTSVFGEKAVTPTMRDFEGWFRRNYPHWLEPPNRVPGIRG
jgi:hypothetical protein